MFERGRGIRKPGECLESQGTCGQDRDFGQPAAGKTGLKIRSWSLEIDSFEQGKFRASFAVRFFMVDESF